MFSFFLIFQLESGQKCCQISRNIPLNLPSLKIFSVDFDNDPKGILKKEKHFQQTVFHADFKSAVKILI